MAPTTRGGPRVKAQGDVTQPTAKRTSRFMTFYTGRIFRRMFVISVVLAVLLSGYYFWLDVTYERLHSADFSDDIIAAYLDQLVSR